MEQNSTSIPVNQNQQKSGCSFWIYVIIIAVVIALSVGWFQSCASLDGTYKLVEMTSGNDTISQDTLTAVEQSAYNASITITINGNHATVNMLTEFEYLTIDQSAKTMTDSTGTIVNYQHSGNRLTLTAEKYKLVFEKQ